MNEAKIAKMMKSLGCSREEAIDIISSDEAIDKGEKLFEMTAEQKKAAKSVTKSSTRKTGEVKRERKVDETKKFWLEHFTDCLTSNGANVTKVKTETEIEFEFDNAKYTLKLTKHRPPKGE